MAVGMKDPVLGPPVMAALRQQIRECPSPLEIPDGGHFVQEWGKEIAEAAVTAFVVGVANVSFWPKRTWNSRLLPTLV